MAAQLLRGRPRSKPITASILGEKLLSLSKRHATIQVQIGKKIYEVLDLGRSDENSVVTLNLINTSGD